MLQYQTSPVRHLAEAGISLALRRVVDSSPPACLCFAGKFQAASGYPRELAIPTVVVVVVVVQKQLFGYAVE